MSAKLLILACLVTSAFALAPTAASAEWDVNGTPLVGSAALLSKEPALAHGIISVQNVGVTVECKGSEVVVSGEIIAPDEVLLKSLDFGQCAASGGSCSLKGETILTLPLRGLANLGFVNSLITNITLLAVSTKVAVLEFEGSLCTLKGSQSITESSIPDLDILLDGGADVTVQHLALFLSLQDLKIPPVKLGSLSAPMYGFHFDMRLTNGQTWNFL